jgi:hypothetical protein
LTVFYFCNKNGLEPVRVLPEKQSAHTAAAWAQPCLLVVFPSSASLHPPPAAVSSLTLPAHHRADNFGYLLFCFYSIALKYFLIYNLNIT